MSANVRQGTMEVLVRVNRSSLLALALVLAGGACAPPAPSTSGLGLPPVAPAPPKVLTIGIPTELVSFGDFAPGSSSGGGCTECRNLAHDRLTWTRPDEVVEPKLAAELPSLETGSWQVNPDGSMDVTWKLRPNVKWQDGTAFTSQDLLFTYSVYKNPELPNRHSAPLQIMTSAAAPDPHTYVVHWSQTFVRADKEPPLEPIAQHIFGDAYGRGDKDMLINSPQITTDFVGLGPYRLVNWEPGSHMEYERFDGYYLGRPPLDRVFVRWVFDANTLLTNILAGAVDAANHNSLDLTAGIEVKQRWEGTGNRVDLEPTGMLMQVQTQQRRDYMRPKNAFVNRTVRQAMYQAIDKAALNEVMSAGLSPTADGWLPPGHVELAAVQSAIPKYPYDAAAAQRLLAEAGWTRGSDGVLVHGPSGERFDVEVWGKPRYAEKPLLVIADGWKAIGAQATIHVIPTARNNDREYEVTYPGAIFTNPGGSFHENYRLHGSYIASAENRWTGLNQPGYANPAFDAILDRLQMTLDRQQRINLHRQLIQEGLGDVAVMPLYWEQRPFFVLKGVTPGWSGATMRWDKQ